MELDKLKIPYVNFKEAYETPFARVEKYKHLRITASASEPVRLFIQWSYDGEEVCLENSMRLLKDKWQTEKMEVVAVYCKVRAVAETEINVERLVVNVLGRYQIMSGDPKKEVRYDMDEPPKPETRHKSPFRKLVGGYKKPEPVQKVEIHDERLPSVLFKNNLLYVGNNLNTVCIFPFPVADGNQYALTVRNNVLEWKECNQL